MNLDTLREKQRAEWTSCAPGWRKYRENFAGPSWPITARMLQLAEVRPGHRILDLACGNGNPTFDLAALVGPDGYVLGLDLTPAMIDEARHFAERRRVRNAEFRVILDESSLGVPANTFDVATCRAGMQYMPEPVAAARAVFDALRPGGRFVVMTLGSPERCMPFMLSNEIVSRHVTLPKLDTETPGPVGLSSIEQLEGVLGDAGFTNVRTDVLTSPIFEAGDPATAWQLFTETAGPFIALFESLDDKQRKEMEEDAVRTFAAAFPDGPVRPTGEALVARGLKPR